MYCVPAIVAALTESQIGTFFSHLSSFSSLYFDTSTFLSAVQATKRRPIHNERDGHPQYYQMPFIFTRKQGVKMMKRFQRHALKHDRDSVGQMRGEWMRFLQGRNKIVIDDVRSELTSVTCKSDNKTIRAGHDSTHKYAAGPVPAQLVPQDRQQPAVNQPDERFFLLAEVESQRNATRIRTEMMDWLEPDAPARRQQVRPASVPDRGIITGEGPIQHNLEATTREQAHTLSGTVRHSHRGRSASQSDAESAANEQAEQRQHRLLADDDFPPIAATDSDRTDLLNLVLSLPNPGADFMRL